MLRSRYTGRECFFSCASLSSHDCVVVYTVLMDWDDITHLVQDLARNFNRGLLEAHVLGMWTRESLSRHTNSILP